MTPQCRHPHSTIPTRKDNFIKLQQKEEEEEERKCTKIIAAHRLNLQKTE